MSTNDSSICLCLQRSIMAEMDVRRITFLVLHKCEFPKYFTYRTRCQVGTEHRGYFYNEMRYINLRFTYLLTYV